MLEYIGLGIGGILLVYAVAAGIDNVAGQPRKSNGRFGKNRTTRIDEVLGIVILLAITVFIMDIIFLGGSISRIVLDMLF